MKKLLFVFLMTIGFNIQAEPVSTAYAFVVAVNMIANSKIDDADLFKTVIVSHADNPNGYSFEITQYEYKQNPSAFVK